jgi:hypothetical protein
VKSFAQLFAGRDDVHGEYTLSPSASPSDKGKLLGRARTLREPVTPDIWQSHLDGKVGLGIVPVLPDSTCNWIAIDVDIYKDENLHIDLLRKVDKLGLPLVLTRSKSNGAHLWCFFQNPVRAKDARDLARTFCKRLGLPATLELYPKQDVVDEKDEGNWINLPYFGNTRLGIGDDGEELSLEEFLKYADQRATRLEDAERGTRDIEEGGGSWADEAPPCIVRMAEEGIEEGGRNQALTHVGIYLRRAFPDDWQERLNDFNTAHLHPALSFSEVAMICESVASKDYQYLCKQQPMQALCNKAQCLKRKYGVGRDEASDEVIQFDNLLKVEGENPIYRITMYGRPFYMDAASLMMYSKFRVKAMAALDRILPLLKQPEWEGILSVQLARMDIQKAPADTDTRDRVIRHFMDWCSQTCTRQSPDLVKRNGIPYYDGTSIFFRGDDFMSIIDRNLKVPRNHVWCYMHEWGVAENYLTVDGKKTPVWQYPVNGPLWFEFRDQKDAL